MRGDRKIVPSNEEDGAAGDLEDNIVGPADDSEGLQPLLRDGDGRSAIMSIPFVMQVVRFAKSITYDQIKKQARWLLEDATCVIKFTVSRRG
jgi:hypothetical protein